MPDKKSSRKEILMTIFIVMISILLNISGEIVAKNFELPVWLESFGTVLSAYTIGPVCGAIVGLSGNVIISFWKGSYLFYSITSIIIAICIGFAAKKNYFPLFNSLNSAQLCTSRSCSGGNFI